MPWTPLCKLTDLTEGKGHYVEAGGKQLAVFLHEGAPYVLDNRCPHAGGSLAGGIVDDGCAVCPWHDWPFRLSDGQLKDSPFVRVDTYPARIVEVPGGAALVEADLAERPERPEQSPT